ncbi:hypothetical protein HOLleu_18059 [Holothuria leucospilota]|uniref:Uncharacterized protein n=1 Tax=Holothuria leucospilota TaxID=206669 RepID=A0A9Q1C377_HOLLE|nr:hypothetical protein HOLleu_18059 [Holothuria leucospilota]
MNSCMRCVLFLTFTEPQEEDAYTRAVLTFIVGLVMLETWGIFVYILYIVRFSFQRHFTLLLSFIEEHEGEIDVCRGVLSEVFSDFSCFRRFSHTYTLVMFPIAFIAMASNLSWEYLMYKACRNNEDVAKIQTPITALARSEIVMGIGLYITAMGAVNIMYLWDNFFRDVRRLHSERYDEFWRKMILCMSVVSNNETNFFLV